MGRDPLQVAAQKRLAAGQNHHCLVAEPRDVVDQRAGLCGGQLLGIGLVARPGIEIAMGAA